ncbi:silencing defective 5 [Striga hermonthica]|uniref:Silencing defective 5 n=1 Tax=Striga hermonthica TaxID=68872 RepID=A0A9N7MQ31_STRHE|nr:silencing defective 5 [Striga hermonthica]
MKVELLPSSSSYTDEDERNLKQLLEAFSSVISLEDIASAYCETGRDLNSTAERLCILLSSHSGASSQVAPDNVENTSSLSSGCASNDIPDNALLTKPKTKKVSASVGSISDVIGKDYFRPRNQSDGQTQKLKPVKINSDEFPVSVIWDEKKESASSSHGESMDRDIQEFLCKMLGDGFQLEKSMIQDVMGECGYNIPMSIDKLIDLSAANLEKSDDVIGVTAENTTKNSLGLGSSSSTTQAPAIPFSGRPNNGMSWADEVELSEAGTKVKDVQREVLEALFTGPDRFEERVSAPPVRPIRRSSAHGQVVTKPPDEKMFEDFSYITRQPISNRSDVSEKTSYEDLRKAVAEYWVIMKEYYKASVEAYTRKDYEKAVKLLEEGNFYMRKAREADELSAKKLIEDSDEEEEFSINMHYLDPKDALQHMKLHLTSLSGLPSVRYLKAVVGTDGTDKKDGRRKRLITKLLDKEGIPWTEEGNGWIISIRVDELDPRSLSFSSK